MRPPPEEQLDNRHFGAHVDCRHLPQRSWVCATQLLLNTARLLPAKAQIGLLWRSMEGSSLGWVGTTKFGAECQAQYA